MSLKAAVFIVMCLLLAACASVPLSTMWALKDFDITTTEIERLRVAVRMPEFVLLKPVRTKMTFGLWDDDRTVDVKYEFVLQKLDKSAETVDLAKFEKPGFLVHAFRLNPRDYSKMETVRRQFAAMKEEFGDKANGSMSITASGCEQAGHEKQPVNMTTFIKAPETGKFVVLSKELDIRKYADLRGLVSVCN